MPEQFRGEVQRARHEHNAAVRRFNELATNYNAVVKELNELRAGKKNPLRRNDGMA